MRQEQVRGADTVLPLLQEAIPQETEIALEQFVRELQELLAAPMQQVEQDLRHDNPASTELGLAFEATPTRAGARHVVRAGGKRLRPIVTLLAHHCAGGAHADTAIDYAIAAELVHNATLLHDDILDDAELRRGQPTVNTLHGNSVAVLAGDHLLVHALQYIQRHGHPAALSGMIEVLSSMVMAEALQLQQKGRFQVDMQTYNTIAEGKTASLFGWCMAAGAMAAKANNDQVDAMRQAGQLFGYAFQLVDDCIDLQGNTARTGKKALTDLQEGKLTYPLLLACQQRPELRETLIAAADQHTSGVEIETALQQILATGSLQQARDTARATLQDCRRILSDFPDNTGRRKLDHMARLLADRIH